MELNERQKLLFEFVKEKHGEQKRKYTGEEYWHHLLSVATIVSNYIMEPGNLIEVALCHDLLEDTNCTVSELTLILTRLGYNKEDSLDINNGVQALTDEFTSEKFPDLNRKERKLKEADRLGKINARYQSVKYADLIDNTRSIVQHDRGFAQKYLEEKREILDRMRGGNIDLLIECCFTLKTSMNSL